MTHDEHDATYLPPERWTIIPWHLTGQLGPEPEGWAAKVRAELEPSRRETERQTGLWGR